MGRTARTLGALMAVVVVGALVVRFIVHDEAGRSTTTVAVEPSAHFVPTDDTRPIRALSSGVDTALAVGDDGLVLRRRGAGWKQDGSPTHAVLRGVAQQLDEAVAVGDSGTMIEYEGAWKVASSPTTRTLRAVAYTSYGVVVVGDGGTLVRRAAAHEAWKLETSGTTDDLYGVCAGLRDVWIVGAAGRILFRKDNAWVLDQRTNVVLRAVACDDDAAIAVGDTGTILERQGGVDWHEVASGTTRDLFAVGSPFGSRSWLVVGARGTAVRMSVTPLAESTGVEWDLDAVTEGPLGTWVGGARGLLRPNPR